MSWNTFLRKNYEKMKQLGIDLKELNTIRLSGGEHYEAFAITASTSPN